MHISKKLLHKKGIVYSALLSLCLLAGMTGGIHTAKAAESSDTYTYTVRVFGGEHGTYDGKAVAVYPNQKAGSTFSVDLDRVGYYPASGTLEPTYHYVGVHESGKDYKEDKGVGEYSRPSFTVNRDVDVVIAYGVDGTTANYTIRYVDRNGNELAASKNFSGSDQEVVVVPYRELQGYYPNAYNLRGTLSKDQTTTFSFVYTPIPQPTPAPVVAPTTTTTVIAPPATTGTTPAGTNGTTGTGVTGTAGTAGTGETGTAGTAGTGETGTAGGTGITGTAGTAGTAGTGNAGTAGTTGTTGTTQNANPAGGTGAADGTAQTTNPASTLPASPDEVPEILDIEDVDVPLANAPGEGNETATGINATNKGNETATGINATDEGNTTAKVTEKPEKPAPASGLPKAAKVGIGAAIAAAVALIVALILLFKKRG